MSLVTAIKHKLGLSVTTANNFLLDASADNGTMKLARESGQDIMTVNAAGKVAFPQNKAPAFDAYATGTLVLATGVTQLIALNEYLDTDNCFLNNRFTPNVPGYYQINGQVEFNIGNTVAMNQAIIQFNGAAWTEARTWSSTTLAHTVSVSALIYCNGTTDYINLAALQTTGANQGIINTGTFMHGYLAREA